MSRYRLPDALGGAELDDAGDSTIGTVAFRFDGVEGLVYLPRAILTEVKTTPPPGYYLIDYPAGPYVFVAEHEDGYGWHLVGYNGGVTWDEVQKLYPGSTFIRLVPDPFAEPVELPVRLGGDPNSTTVDVSGHDLVLDQILHERSGTGHGILLSALGARAKARALWAAADKAEAQP